MTSSYFQRGGAFAEGRWALFLVAGCILLMLALKAGDIMAGQFTDNDDLLRLQQVRDLLAGQNWFNVDQSRLLTPEGGEMHWSRLPDLFIGAIILITRPFLGQANAEIAALIVWPLLVLSWAMTMLIMAMRRLGVGLIGQVIGLVFLAMSGAIFKFWVGRIDHHNLVLALTLTSFVAALSSRLTAQSGVIAAGCLAALISVAIEGLPYAGALVFTFGLFWIVRGHREAVRLTAFGIALMGFSTLFYVLDAPGWGARRMVCDAYGTSHWVGLVCGGGLFALLGIFGGWLDTWQKRLGAGVLAGTITLGLMLLSNPACLGDPYAEVSDQVRLAWLNAVGEARGLGQLWIDAPSRAVWQVGFVASGLVAALLMAWKAPEGQRLPRIALAMLMTLAALATVWQVRGVTFSHAFGVIAAGWLVGSLFERWWTQRGTGPVLALTVGALAMAPVSWQVLSRPFERSLPYAKEGKSYNILCLDAAGYEEMAKLEPLKILTPIDLGMSVIAHTPHSVFSGPYHRNVKGIERASAVFLGKSEQAQGRILEMGATHMLYCQGLNETSRYETLNAESFAAQLNRGEVPGWLEPVDGLTETDGIVRLYRVKPQ